ncbi:PilN domain-containing protein [Nannocystaceae bacterium ST9]
MIRINLSPSVRRRPAGKPSKTNTVVARALPTTQVSRGSMIAVAMILGWIALGVVGWLLIGNIEKDSERLKAESAKLAADIKALTDQINEEELQARSDRYEQLKAAKERVETKRRTPVYVLHEVANVMTTGRGPDKDEAEYRRQVERDPQAKLDEGWDATSVWLASVEESENDVLEIKGGARDPDDLSEFVKRLRASARFERVSHPEFKLEEVKPTSASAPAALLPGKIDQDFYTFELTAKVRYWD